MSGWYDVVTTVDLEQGDILRDVSILKPVAVVGDTADELDGDVVTLDVVVLTQTCDLEHKKVDHILVAQVLAYDEMAVAEHKRGNQALSSSSFRDKLIEGLVPNLALLHEHTDAPPMPWSLANFRVLNTVPISTLRLNAEPRLRLVPPYKEYLAQSFARFMMRVGLPLTAHSFRGHTPPKPSG